MEDKSWEIFQPTPSARRVTLGLKNLVAVSNISTHTLRKEGDFFTALSAT